MVGCTMYASEDPDSLACTRDRYAIHCTSIIIIIGRDLYTLIITVCVLRVLAVYPLRPDLQAFCLRSRACMTLYYS